MKDTRWLPKATLTSVFVGGVLAAILAGCGTVHREEPVALSTLPAAVQSTVQAHTYGGTIAKVEKETRHGDPVVYEAQVKGNDGERSEMKVAESGKLLKYRVCDEEGEHHEAEGSGDKDQNSEDRDTK